MKVYCVAGTATTFQQAGTAGDLLISVDMSPTGLKRVSSAVEETKGGVRRGMVKTEVPYSTYNTDAGVMFTPTGKAVSLHTVLNWPFKTGIQEEPEEITDLHEGAAEALASAISIQCTMLCNKSILVTAAELLASPLGMALARASNGIVPIGESSEFGDPTA